MMDELSLTIVCYSWVQERGRGLWPFVCDEVLIRDTFQDNDKEKFDNVKIAMVAQV